MARTKGKAAIVTNKRRKNVNDSEDKLNDENIPNNEQHKKSKRNNEKNVGREEEEGEHVGSSRWIDLFYQPVKDLAANWNIDLEDELSEYLKQITHISGEDQEIDLQSNELSNVNFAEAAIIIQGSAMIYSKKVEYLYKLMFDVLDMIISKKRKEEMQKTSLTEDGKDEDVSISVPLEKDGTLSFEFLPLDDDLKVCDDSVINLQENIEDPKILSPLSRMKRLVGFNQNRISFIKQTMTGKGLKSFALANSFMDESGFLYMDEADGETVKARSSELSQSRSQSFHVSTPPRFEMPQVDLDIQLPAEEPIQTELRDTQIADMDFDDDQPDFDDDPIDNVDIVPDESEPKDDKASDQTEQVIRPTKKNENLWEMADPYDDLVSKWNRPFKKGNPFMKVTKAAIEKQTSGVDAFALMKLEFYPWSEKRSSSSAFFPEFDEYIRKETAKKRALSRKNSSTNHSAPTSLKEDHSTCGAEVNIEHENGDDHFDAINDFSPEQDLAAMDTELHDDVNDFDPWQDDGVDDHHDDNSPHDGDGHGANEELVKKSAPLSYEEQCRQRIEEYIRKLESFAEQTELGQRVKVWENRIRPLLEEEEQHNAYDIKEYGQKLLKKVESIEKDKLQKQTVKNCTVEFAEAVGGMCQFEVCRYFLATLQLANMGKVHLSPDETNESLCLSLL